MFRYLAAQVVPPVGSGAEALVTLHPVELTALLEGLWNARPNQAGPPNPPATGHPNRRSDIPGVNVARLTPPLTPIPAGAQNPPAAPFVNLINRLAAAGPRWEHLIYAYMIENTRIYEIFRRVVYELVHGEKLGTPGSPNTQLWLRNTEELFYRDPAPFSITTLTSHIRPDLRASRRNAYQRMFGMDLNHGADDNSPYPFVRAEASNKEFVPTFEELLREVWVGHINRTTTSGARPTDDTKIAELAHKLHDMLITRRQGGNLSREEFYFVAMMSWFHLTVESDLPIILNLRAEGTSPEQRLFKVAQLVGLPAHGLSRSYFEIAEDISAVLIAIETGAFNGAGAAPLLYDPTLPNQLAGFMTRIITHWSLITGRDIKAGKVAPS